MRKGWLDPEKASLIEVAYEFKRRYPLCCSEKLNGQMMRRVLAGDWAIVKMGGRQKYEFWKKVDVTCMLKKWNGRVAAQCRVIPPLPLKGDPWAEERALAEEFCIMDVLTPVSTEPRKFTY